MATAIGKPLKVDAPTLNMTWPSVARFCVEVDLTKEFPKSVKVGKKGKKHDQIFTYEPIPAYCTKCNKIGHKKEDCWAGLQKVVDKKKKAPVKIVDREKAATNPSAQDATNPSAQGVAASASVAATDRPSSSGLSAKEKKKISVDVHDTAAKNQSKEDTSFTDSPPQSNEPRSDEEFIESVYVEDSPNKEVEEICRVDDHVESCVLALMSLTETPHIFSVDNDIGLHGAGLENDTGSWSEGEKDEVDKLDEIKRELAFDIAFSSNNSKIWVFCKSEIQASLLSDDDQVLHFEIKHPLVSQSYFLSAVYAKSTRAGRRDLWQSLEGFKRNNMGAPWMVSGDFNVIRSLEEYSGVSVQDHPAIEDFNMCIQACNLLEIPAVGEDFTWGGTRQTGWVNKKLDRVLFSDEWLDFFQVNSIENLSRTSSDHSPMLHMFGVQGVSKPRVFQFQQMWLRRSEFFSVVKENWE
ncbi:OLC1v1030206C1 [Oldenlandia corymbosa var. corymbosa]|uniref:OLC1v1030206C1 n=1 Tax=Oldenlandia corymbosa var. corymbosa TaxID=529605 RepID=A0AAV1CGJ3_OLDCO|nr:OLC1v1030206C1 [Oldenlandia corymbosa var. corymbosa]